MEKKKAITKYIRKTWGINPKTRVKPNIKKERREKDKIRKELKEAY